MKKLNFIDLCPIGLRPGLNRGIICVFFLLAFSMCNINAQEALSAAGGDAHGEAGSVSYTIGQVTYATYTGSNGSIIQGVQQAYEIFQTNDPSNTEPENIRLRCLAFPNPTAGQIVLEISDSEFDDLYYQVFDISGKLLLNDMIRSSLTQIELDHFKSNIFIINVHRGNELIRTFKIIKTQ